MLDNSKQLIDTDQVMNKNYGNINSKSNTFINNAISMKIDQHRNILFRGQDCDLTVMLKIL